MIVSPLGFGPSTIARPSSQTARIAGEAEIDQPRQSFAVLLPPHAIAPAAPVILSPLVNLGLGEPADGRDERHAEIFNQHGFFGSPITDPDLAPEEGVPAPYSILRSVSAQISQTAAQEETLEIATPLPNRSAPTKHAASRLPLEIVRTDRSAILKSAGLPLPLTPSIKQVDRQISVQRTGSASVPRPPSSSRLSHSLIDVALQELGAGVRVVARLETLDEADREALIDDIVALLGRHGMSASDVTILAASRDPNRGEA